MGTECPSEPTPWCLFGFFLGIQKEARRPQAAKPLRIKYKFNYPLL